jgi:ribonucleoside-diphosphate reductase beta chain
MFEQVSVHLNETQITPTSTLYPYRAFIESVLGRNGEYQKTLGRTALFVEMDDEKSTASAGYILRRDVAEKSGVFDLVARPFLDICGTNHYMIPNTDVRIKFHKSSPAFCLQEVKVVAATAARASYNIVIESAKLTVQKVAMIPSILATHLKLLQKGETACYPMRRVEVKSYALPKGTVQNVNETLLSGRLPDRIIIGLVNSEDLHGTISTTPFNFTDFKLQNISVTVNGDSNYHKSVNIDADSNFVIEPYYNMFSELSLDPCDEGPHVTLERFKKGKMFFVFNLNNIAGGDSFELQRHGTIKIETKFGTALPDSVNVICHADYQSTLLIDSNKGVYFKE